MTAQPNPAADLTRIPGIGCQTAAQLKAAGIHTVDQLAQASVEQVVAACPGRAAAATVRAQGWIEQAAELADEAGTAIEEPPVGRRPHLRRTFTVEVRVDGDTPQVLATQVSHVESQEAEAWQGWRPERLVEFLEARIGVAGSIADPAPRPVAVPAGTATPPALVVHRFGVLKAARPASAPGETAARLRLDPADLDLPAGRTAVAQVELLARPVGRGRAVVLDARDLDLLTDRLLDVVLRGRLPDQDPPFTVSAVVRVMVDQPSGTPREGLGGGTLQLAPSADRPA